ncbi:MAG: phosphoglucomutase/phosphomannomutase family protein [Bacteroidetes bacterium]|nr:phosphoglucomutase/phosphomannomutase family protein [Bacteroidota bacterium]MBV6459929.1 Phosphoglucosamine mutase [Flavobacteriales bacterium]WKZ76426.1 MAG: phosphoglucomutase/phosphomannomutase family protein [Vicingaceae bacterium]MCL4816347.1 phosphoglucomutase/phosphomannomutase family protein [Flavobacteriales bacterium]NOG95325.1 phosphoglucomutase/phosphomannomutase family protein [Bacteroidota bacterium]
MSSKIKFGTDGWRAVIGKEYTVENVARVTLGVATWLKNNFKNPSVVVGHDCRFNGFIFSETVAAVLCANGIKVFRDTRFVSTPMVSLGAVKLNTSLGIIITASHNPPEYSGYKLKGNFGGPLLPAQIQEIEDLIPEKNNLLLEGLQMAEYEKSGLLSSVDLETLYVQHIEKHFDLDAIRSISHSLAFDAMFGSGQNVIKRILPEVTCIHCEHNPGFEGIPPEPILRNLHPFSQLISESEGEIKCGLATDGDADRIGLFDRNGNFVDSHHIILLLIKYLIEVKKMKGKVVIAFSVSPKVKKLCEHYGLQYEVTKIGFKYIAEIMLKEDVVLGGEESGGIAIKGHIPERDGIWMGLTIWEYMAKSGKTLEELIEDVYAIVGKFAYERIDLHVSKEVKQRILSNCKAGKYNQFGPFAITHSEDIDGWKYYLENDCWVMIRASGTEPVLRTYAQGTDSNNALEILKQTHSELL